MSGAPRGAAVPSYGAAGAPPKAKAKRSFGLTGEDLAKAIGCVALPPIVFFGVTALLCFRFRFRFPRGAWFLAFLFATPAFGVVALMRRESRLGNGSTDKVGWLHLALVLFLAAFVAAATAGDLIYWYFSQPFFLLDSLTAYDEVNPAEIDGLRLMDAGRVRFAEGARLATDMAMSFTSWDIYCVAPITTAEGLPSQGSRLNSYDLWAVGVNCCNSAEANFHCGAYDKPKARAALRQVSAEARPYFRLAVQQAEGAYNIQANHPLFFYWVEDPQEEQKLFFEAAFSNWVLANGLHFGVNAFAVLVYVVLFNKATKERDAHLAAALGL